ncbi:ABC transporter permease [Kurthia sibirica]|uniref:Peptide ABC transporter permease n=1 Tax=Kurthia sibirica TaxID=202750 RepID=A0A2U3AJ56_9BACL|nr:ABC transporter permease [Kurthia sibirica]PWI24558.1 peptide ABC transporter permease [Kurthia sibirica]GEK33509.1 peptide ABC transporter permease [Kurthia sibirica]
MTDITKLVLKQTQTYKQAGYALLLSILLTCVFIYNLLQKIDSKFWLLLTILYLFTACIQLLILWQIKSATKKTQMLNVLLYIQLCSLLIGNVFTATNAFAMLRSEKSIEYTLSYFALVLNWFMIAVSAINLYKPNVSIIYMIGMSLLMLGFLVNLLLVSYFYKKNQTKKKTKIYAYLASIGLVMCNLFMIILAIHLFFKLAKHSRFIMHRWTTIWYKLTKDFLAMMGMFFIFFLIGISVTSIVTFKYEYAIEINNGTILQGASKEFPFGTDHQGRDVFSKIIFGARISLIIAFLSTLIPMIIGGVFGVISGYYKKFTHHVLVRIFDLFNAIPGLLLAIVIVSAFGANVYSLIIAMSLSGIPKYAQTMRLNVLKMTNKSFVLAARALGEKDRYIIWRLIIPQTFAPMLIKVITMIGGVTIATSSLTYIGMGVGARIPEWGNILRLGSLYLDSNPYIAILPGVIVIFQVLSFNFLGDALKNIFKPKLE